MALPSVVQGSVVQAYGESVVQPADDGNGVTAKSVVFDFADNHGFGTYISVRSIEFWSSGSKLALVAADLTAYSTSEFSASFIPGNAFDTSLSKTGSHTDTQWISGNGEETNQRLIVVFDTPQAFDKIVINNGHDTGATTHAGAQNTVIQSSTDAITSTVHGEAVANATGLFNGALREHTGADEVDDQTPYGTPNGWAKSVVFDFADNYGYSGTMAFRSVEFYFEEALISFDGAVGITTYETSQLSGNYSSEFIFDTLKSKAGTSVGTSWASSGADTNQRVIVVFDNPQTFDKIVVNNYHNSGIETTLGAQNTVIQSSTNEVTDATYGADVPSFTELFDGAIDEHAAADAADDQIIYGS